MISYGQYPQLCLCLHTCISLVAFTYKRKKGLLFHVYTQVTTITTLATRMAGLVAQLPPFDPDATVGASLAPRWKTWVSDFTTYLVANAIDDNKRKRALLLYFAGSRVREIFRHLTDTGGDEDFDTALTALTNYFEPHRNRLYEV